MQAWDVDTSNASMSSAQQETQRDLSADFESADSPYKKGLISRDDCERRKAIYARELAAAGGSNASCSESSKLIHFCRPTLVKGDVAVDFSGRPSVCPFLIKVFLFPNISVSIHRIAFIIYIQLPKDIDNTFAG